MTDSTDRPWGNHDLDSRFCEYCGDEFYSSHGLQRYCPEKFGRHQYCKNQQKKLLSESKLAEKANALAKIGMKVAHEEQLEKNKHILSSLMGSDWQKMVDSETLDSLGYDINYFDSRSTKNESNGYLLHLSEFTLEWIGQISTALTFNITRK